MRATEFIVEANSLPDGIAAAEQSGVKLMPLPGSDFKMVQIGGRPIVVANVNGFPIPFYVSTGRGGKAGVASNQWYPFWGIGSDGWFNKGSERQINSYYDNPQLKRIADVLNNSLPNVLGNRSAIPDGGGAIAAINAGKSPITYKQGSANPEPALKKMDNMGKSLAAHSAAVRNSAPPPQSPGRPAAPPRLRIGLAHLPNHLPGQHDTRLPYQQDISKPAIQQIVPPMLKEKVS
jgi:hypothetical protein